MQKKEMKQKGIAIFNGLTVGANKTVTVKFKFRYDEMLTSINLLQGLNNDITILAKCPDRKAENLGLFTIGSISFDKDGNATIPFKSLIDSVNLDAICRLVDEEYVQLMFKAVLELPGSDVEEVEEGELPWAD